MIKIISNSDFISCFTGRHWCGKKVEVSGRLFKELSRNFAGVTHENHEISTQDSWPNRNSSFSSGDSWFSRKTTLLTPWCRVLPEKLTGLQLVKKFPAFHGTRRFITALTSVRHLSLSWASPIQSTYPHPTSWRSVLILSTHLRLGLPSGLQEFYV